MLNFDDLVKDVVDEITGLAREKLGGLVNEAKKDAQSFLKSTEEDFKRWLTLLKDGHLTRDDFTWLSKSKKDLIEMFALKQLKKTTAIFWPEGCSRLLQTLTQLQAIKKGLKD